MVHGFPFHTFTFTLLLSLSHFAFTLSLSHFHTFRFTLSHFLSRFEQQKVQSVQALYEPVHGYLALSICIVGIIFNIINVLVLTHRFSAPLMISTVRWPIYTSACPDTIPYPNPSHLLYHSATSTSDVFLLSVFVRLFDGFDSGTCGETRST